MGDYLILAKDKMEADGRCDPASSQKCAYHLSEGSVVSRTAKVPMTRRVPSALCVRTASITVNKQCACVDLCSAVWALTAVWMLAHQL